MPSPEPVAWSEVEGGVELAVRVTSRATAARVDGLVTRGGATWLQVRLPAPPVEGAANRALVAFLAEALGTRRTDVTLVAGARAREKRLLIRGAGLPRRLAAVAARP